MKEERQSARKLGFMGESYVLYKLSALGLYGTKMPSEFDYDILCSNDARIEVKAARLTTRNMQYKRLDGTRKTEDVWQFSNHITQVNGKNGERRMSFKRRDRKCDFFIFVCFDREGKEIVKSYVIPKELVTKAINIKIPVNTDHLKIGVWEEEWLSLVNFTREPEKEVVMIGGSER